MAFSISQEGYNRPFLDPPHRALIGSGYGPLEDRRSRLNARYVVGQLASQLFDMRLHRASFGQTSRL